jgi:hypothetical protein
MSQRNRESIKILAAAAVTTAIVMGLWTMAAAVTPSTTARFVLATLGFACFAALADASGQLTRKAKP